MNRYLVCIIIMLCWAPGYGQDIPLHDFWNREIEKIKLTRATPYATSYKPLLQSETDFNQFPSQIKDSAKYYWNINRILFRDHWIEYKKEDVSINVDPWIDASYFQDRSNPDFNNQYGRQYNNSRGARIQGKIGSTFSFHTGFLENQSYFPYYMTLICDSLSVVPGMGRFKAFKGNGYDYAISSSALNIEPNSHFHLTLQYGRQMIGNGYRSLLLSDAAMNYPFVSSRISFNKWTYVSSAGLMQEQQRIPLGATAESLFKRKINTWNYIIFHPFPAIELGIMESVSYSIWNEQGRKSPQYSIYIPLLGARSALSSDTTSTTLYGLNLKWNVAKKFTIYGQYASMRNQAKSKGVQAGVLYSNFLIKNLDVRLEYNTTDPYLYATKNDLLSYSQQSQSLGHPAGGDLKEWLIRMDYRYKRFLLHGDINQITQNIGGGADIYVQDFHSIPFGVRSLIQWQGQFGILVNPKSNLCLWMGYTHRHDVRSNQSQNWSQKVDASLITISLSSTFHSRYFDF